MRHWVSCLWKLFKADEIWSWEFFSRYCSCSGCNGSSLKNTRSDFVHMLSFAFRDQLKTEDSLDSPTSPSQWVCHALNQPVFPHKIYCLWHWQQLLDHTHTHSLTLLADKELLSTWNQNLRSSWLIIVGVTIRLFSFFRSPIIEKDGLDPVITDYG